MSKKDFSNIYQSIKDEEESNKDRFENVKHFQENLDKTLENISKIVIRIGVSITEKEQKLIDEIQYEASEKGFLPNKSEIIRAGIFQLSKLTPKEIREILKDVERIKPGRKL